MNRRWKFPLKLAFFGLTLEYRPIIFKEVFELTYHGKGGFNYWEVYYMPIWLRRFNIQKINEVIKKQNEEVEKAQKGNSPNATEIAKPNIPNKSSYNFKA